MMSKPSDALYYFRDKSILSKHPDDTYSTRGGSLSKVHENQEPGALESFQNPRCHGKLRHSEVIAQLVVFCKGWLRFHMQSPKEGTSRVQGYWIMHRYQQLSHSYHVDLKPLSELMRPESLQDPPVGPKRILVSPFFPLRVKARSHRISLPNQVGSRSLQIQQVHPVATPGTPPA